MLSSSSREYIVRRPGFCASLTVVAAVCVRVCARVCANVVRLHEIGKMNEGAFKNGSDLQG